jgi:large subunit ribosomal protein L5
MSKISYKEQLNKNKAQLHNLHITKVVVNCGIGKLVTHTAEKQDNIVKEISEYLMAITGQKPKVCNARVSVSGFKLREGMPVGLMVTLRGKRMNDFIDRFVNITLPRTRDF